MNRTAIILLLFVISCSEPKQVDTNPYNPNVGITVSGLEKSGWKLTTADNGVCVYESSDANPRLVFYSDMHEDCKPILSQELYIDLGYQQEQEGVDFDVTEAINIKIDSVLLTYSSMRTTEFTRAASCRLEFVGENQEKKRIGWSIMNCNDKITLTAYSKLK